MLNQPNHWEVMVDLETMGTNADAAVTAIGAVAFNPYTRTLHPTPFYAPIDLVDASRFGKLDASTVKWWLNQSTEAQAMYRLPPEKYFTTFDALITFYAWAYALCNSDNLTVWGNGAAFDNVILRALTQRVIPDHSGWKFWNDRCYRTIKSLHPHIKVTRLGTHHNAMEDALTQTAHLLSIIETYAGANK